MTPSRFPDTASATFRTAKQKEEKDLFPYVSVPRFDTSLTVVLNEKRSASILSIVCHNRFAARLWQQQECRFSRVMLFKSWLKNRQFRGRWLQVNLFETDLNFSQNWNL